MLSPGIWRCPPGGVQELPVSNCDVVREWTLCRENCEDHKPKGTLCNEEVDAVPAVKKRVAQGPIHLYVFSNGILARTKKK